MIDLQVTRRIRCYSPFERSMFIRRQILLSEAICLRWGLIIKWSTREIDVVYSIWKKNKIDFVFLPPPHFTPLASLCILCNIIKGSIQRRITHRTPRERERVIGVDMCVHTYTVSFSLSPHGTSNVVWNIRCIWRWRACAHDCQTYHPFFPVLWIVRWHKIFFRPIEGVCASLIRRLFD